VRMTSRDQGLRSAAIGVGALAAAFIIACGSAPSVASGSPAPGASPAGSPLVVGDSFNGKTVSVHVGDRLVVRLGSTYWMFAGSSDTQVLAPVGQVQVSPQPSGCVPGGGCGTATATFDVVGAGSAVVTASRISCGEAMGCTGAEGSFRLTVEASA
jgi:hypothetical protein